MVVLHITNNKIRRKKWVTWKIKSIQLPIAVNNILVKPNNWSFIFLKKNILVILAIDQASY